MAVFALEQRVFLVKKPGSNPVLLFCPARLHFPSGSQNHLTSEGAFPAPWPAPKIFLVIPESEVPEFKKLLVRYYEGEDPSVIAGFMKERCWKTIEH